MKKRLRPGRHQGLCNIEPCIAMHRLLLPDGRLHPISKAPNPISPTPGFKIPSLSVCLHACRISSRLFRKSYCSISSCLCFLAPVGSTSYLHVVHHGLPNAQLTRSFCLAMLRFESANFRFFLTGSPVSSVRVSS